MTKLFVAISFIAAAALAQEIPVGFTPILIPVSVSAPTPGAYGTLWESDVWVHNGLDVPYAPLRTCPSDPLFGCFTHAPNTTELEVRGALQSPLNTILMYVRLSDASNITYSSRLFELSRHTQPVGVDTPIVREQDLFTSSVRFIGVSGSTASRVALRVYDPVRSDGSVVRVEFLATNNATIAETVLPLPHDTNIFDPGFAAILDVANSVPQLRGVERYDIRVTPLAEGMRFYALVSVTDTDSQQVLLVTVNP